MKNTESGNPVVSIVKYREPLQSVKETVSLAGGLDEVSKNAKVFLKPNVVFWAKDTPFPKWGVITTSRVVEDMVIILKEMGINDITIGEGMVNFDPKDHESSAHAFEALGYNLLGKRYGVKTVNVHERPFEKVEIGEGMTLNFNTDFLNSDFLFDIPVLKTHAQTVVSLGIKNLKGVLDMKSRKRCHSADLEKDLNFMISKLVQVAPPSFTILDGIYTNSRGPGFDGKIKRSNILVGSRDMLAADIVGARILGYDVSEVAHLSWAVANQGRTSDFSDIEIKGKAVEDVASHHEYTFPYTKDGSLPLPMKRLGIEGLSYRKYDSTMCTYCSFLNGPILAAIGRAWKGEPWDDVEVLTGKLMKPTPGKKKTILIGKCIYQANKNDPNIKEMFPVKGCPPSISAILEAFSQAGIELDPVIFENLDNLPGFFMRKYEGKPEYDDAFFRVI